MCYERIYLVGIVFPDNVLAALSPNGANVQWGKCTSGERASGSKFQIQICFSCPVASAFKLLYFSKPWGPQKNMIVQWSKGHVARKSSDEKKYQKHINSNFLGCSAAQLL